jgi:hypothetical protein
MEQNRGNSSKLVPTKTVPTKVNINKYCCANKCFETPRTLIDTIACERCKSYCYCRCKCVTYMKERYIKRRPGILFLNKLFEDLIQEEDEILSDEGIMFNNEDVYKIKLNFIKNKKEFVVKTLLSYETS